MSDAKLLAYYARRAGEYERIYQRPERQDDLRELAAQVAGLAAGRDILEIACGTGYWTAIVAPVARSVVATDLAEEVLEIARRKPYPPGKVRFAKADAYSPWAPESQPALGAQVEGPQPRLAAFQGRFTGAMAGFWWSHVPRQRLALFLQRLGCRLETGSRVIFFDNHYVPGSSSPISRRDGEGNSYQRRTLSDGSEHEVRKNFPQPSELLAAAAPHGEQAAVVDLRHYWLLTYLSRN